MSSKDPKQAQVLRVTGRRVSLVGQALVCLGWRAGQREGSTMGVLGATCGHPVGGGVGCRAPVQPWLCPWPRALCLVEGLGGDSEHLREAWGPLELGWVSLSDCE